MHFSILWQAFSNKISDIVVVLHSLAQMPSCPSNSTAVPKVDSWNKVTVFFVFFTHIACVSRWLHSAHCIVLFPSIQQSIIRSSPAALALWGGMFFSVPPLATPLQFLLIIWAWRRIIYPACPVSIWLLLEVNHPHSQMIHLSASRPNPFSEITGACHQVWTSTNTGSIWKASVGARWQYVSIWDVSVCVRVELVFAAVRKYHLIWSLNELLYYSQMKTEWRKKKEKSIKRWHNCQMALFSSTSSP